MSSTKTLSIFLKLNSKGFTSSLKKVEGRLNKLGGKLSKIGSSMTTSVSMPLIGLGAIAVKTASEFEASMTKIQTLVGLPKDAVDQLGDSVLNLSGKVATGPKELADGLYFLTSAGLDAESAMKALEAVAKGSASGLGDMESLSVVAAAAQNAYGEEVLSSSQALDIFGSMVQSGMFKSEELANVLGSQLGLAANLGIEMEEVGAMIATYTRTTGSATDATTGLSGIMMSFAKITPKAEAALAKATEGMEGGALSADDLRKHLAGEGLQGTLLMLKDQFEKSGVPLSEFFSKSQALKGVLGIVGTQAESYTEILGNMENAQGFVNDAFDETSETSAFKFKQALANLQTAGVQLGESLMPIATKIADKLSRLTSSFSNMSDESREKIVKFGLALIALGPTLFLVGKLVSVFGLLVKGIRIARAATLAFGAAAQAMNPIAWVVAAIVAAVGLLIYNWDWTKKKIVEVTNTFIDLYNESVAFKVIVEGIKYAFKVWFESMKSGITLTGKMLSGLGNMIVDLLNFKSPKESFKDMMDSMAAETKKMHDKAVDLAVDMIENVQSKAKIEFIDEDDVDAQITAVGDQVNGLIDGISGSLGIDDLFSGGGDDVTQAEIDAVANIDGITFGDGVELDEDGNPVVKIYGSLDTEQMTETIKELESATQQAFDGMANATDGGADAMGKAILSNTRDVIKAKTAEATASLAASIFATIPPPLNAILAAGAGALIGTLFNQIIPPLAAGGLITGPTLAMVGEGGSTSINPEVVAPLDKLRGMIGGGGGGALHGSISGSDILLSNDRSTYTQDRVSGSVTNF